MQVGVQVALSDLALQDLGFRHTEVESLYHMVILFLIFRGTVILFSTVLAVLHSYQQRTSISISPHLSNICFLLFFE